MCMYVSEICSEGIFVTFPWWLKNVKSRSKIALFSNERHFEIWFPKKRTITFFWSKLSKLHKKHPILHVATTFSLKQGTKNKPWTHSTPLKSYSSNWIMLLLPFTSAPLVLRCDRFDCGSRQIKRDPVDLVKVDYDITLRWPIAILNCCCHVYACHRMTCMNRIS